MQAAVTELEGRPAPGAVQPLHGARAICAGPNTWGPVQQGLERMQLGLGCGRDVWASGAVHTGPPGHGVPCHAGRVQHLKTSAAGLKAWLAMASGASHRGLVATWELRWLAWLAYSRLRPKSVTLVTQCRSTTRLGLCRRTGELLLKVLV